LATAKLEGLPNEWGTKDIVAHSTTAGDRIIAIAMSFLRAAPACCIFREMEGRNLAPRSSGASSK